MKLPLPMPLIAPSLLSVDFGRLNEELHALEDLECVYHFDVMDASFVPEISFGTPLFKAVKAATKKMIDVHLMVRDPSSQVKIFLDLGADMISFHAEAATHPHALIKLIQERGAMAGMALNPGTPLSAVEELVPILDYVMLMSVNPGYPGQKYIEETGDKIIRLRKLLDEKNSKALIEVDGGIKLHNIREVIAAGVDMAVAGSAVFSADNPREALISLQEEAEKGYGERSTLI